MTTLYTFGDSILDCGRFNEHGVTPGALIVRNDDALFPEFQGRDLPSRGPARLEHRAYDGSIVRDLPGQARHLAFTEPAIALVTVGGNDLLHGLLIDQGPGIEGFARVLDRFLAALPIRPVLVGNVYDPTLGEDARNFLGIDPAVARAGLDRMNRAIAAVAARHGTLVDLHAHFLTGDESWFYNTIEPSLLGASEVRRCFLAEILGDPVSSPTPADRETRPVDPGPRTGAYYWIPRPGPDGLAWDLTTCHDFDVSDGISHREFWPHVVERLAAGWGKKSSALKRRLRDHYAGLPRGRVTRPGGKTFIFHGEDSPVPDWQERVISAFRLDPRATRTPTDEHERMLWDDRRRVEDALGIDLGRDTARGDNAGAGPRGDS